MTQITTTEFKFENPILDLRKNSIINNPLIPITFGDPNNPHGIESLTRIVIALTAVADIALDYIGIKSIWKLFLSPIQLVKDFMAIVDAFRGVTMNLKDAWLELKDLNLEEIKTLLNAILTAIQERVK